MQGGSAGSGRAAPEIGIRGEEREVNYDHGRSTFMLSAIKG